jgi:hypothetical protein
MGKCARFRIIGGHPMAMKTPARLGRRDQAISATADSAAGARQARAPGASQLSVRQRRRLFTGCVSRSGSGINVHNRRAVSMISNGSIMMVFPSNLMILRRLWPPSASSTGWSSPMFTASIAFVVTIPAFREDSMNSGLAGPYSLVRFRPTRTVLVSNRLLC